MQRIVLVDGEKFEVPSAMLIQPPLQKKKKKRKKKNQGSEYINYNLNIRLRKCKVILLQNS